VGDVIANSSTRRSPERLSQWQCLRADFERYLELYAGYPRHSWVRKLKIALTEEAFWVIFWYRLGRWVFLDVRLPVVRQICLFVYKVGFRFLRFLVGISISAECEVGPGLYFGHFGGIWINPRARFGRNASVMNGVTIGIGGQGRSEGVPEFGDFVYIGPHAMLAGKLRVGNGCTIGANSTVVIDVRDGATALGVPARIFLKGGNLAAARASRAAHETRVADSKEPPPPPGDAPR
jgi:serine O-acetyltransferase